MADYSSAAESYWQAGFKGVLPLPPLRKEPTPSKYTGYKAKWPEWSDIQAWKDNGFSAKVDGEFRHFDSEGANLAVHLPNTVVGIDVDAYGDKKGEACLEEAVSRWGPLPETVKSTSRLDGVSGIQLFRVPAGVELRTLITFPERNLDGIEICQYFHRYVVAWPSVHPDTGRVYRWLSTKGDILAKVPHIGSLPELPQRWLDGLRRTTALQTDTNVNVDEVLGSLTLGSMSFKVEDVFNASVTQLENSTGGRHDLILKFTGTLFRLSEQGESGVAEAIRELGLFFVEVVTRDGSRTEEEAWSEWDRVVQGQRIHDLIADTPSFDLQSLLGKKPAEVNIAFSDRTPDQTLAPQSSVANPSSAAVPQKLYTEDYSYGNNAKDSDDFDSFLFGEQTDAFDLLLLSTPEEGTTETRTSWGPVDLEAILDGDLTPEEPSVLSRDDGKQLLYAGRINAFVGVSESGKSWLALMACVETLQDGKGVVFLDFEDAPHNVIARLLALGVPREVLKNHFKYVGPDTPMGPVEKEELFGLLDTVRPSVIVLDGVNAAMALIGLDLEKNQEATQFHQWILKPLAVTGATVIVVDHVTKDVTTRSIYAIGAQAKRAMIDGTMIGVNAVETFGRGRLGKLELTILKDKPGGVRALAEKRGKAGVDYLASAIIDAREEGKVAMRLIFEDGPSNTEETPEVSLRTKMGAVSMFLEKNDPGKEGVSKSRLKEGVGGQFQDTQAAMTKMVEEGYVSLKEGKMLYGKVPQLYTLEKPYYGPGNQAVHDLAGG